jgi:hypothetical protein
VILCVPCVSLILEMLSGHQAGVTFRKVPLIGDLMNECASKSNSVIDVMNDRKVLIRIDFY